MWIILNIQIWIILVADYYFSLQCTLLISLIKFTPLKGVKRGIFFAISSTLLIPLWVLYIVTITPGTLRQVMSCETKVLWHGRHWVSFRAFLVKHFVFLILNCPLSEYIFKSCNWFTNSYSTFQSLKSACRFGPNNSMWISFALIRKCLKHQEVYLKQKFQKQQKWVYQITLKMAPFSLQQYD